MKRLTYPQLSACMALILLLLGTLQTIAQTQVQSFITSNVLDIKTYSLVENTIVYTEAGAKYIVSNTGITGYTPDDLVVVPTANGKFAILQTRDGGFYVEDFGAVPNDVFDDSEAIQKCVDAVIALKNITSKVNFGPGEFLLDKGIVMARLTSQSADFQSVTIQVSGNIPVYSKNLNAGSVTLLRLTNPTFGFAIQRGRNCLIENIFFQGAADYEGFSVKQIVENTATDWEDGGNARLNRYSPSCAIAIDPFHSIITGSNQYPNFKHMYPYNPDNNGTSMLTISGCAFKEHYIAISNNSSSGAQNGDNIRVENSHVKRCHTFWAAGQTQSRSNSIDNIYSTFLKTFVDCGMIGTSPHGKGTPPAITNCNIAGFTKEVVRMPEGGFGPFRMSNCYMESVFSLGSIAGLSTSFHQCHIKFFIKDQFASDKDKDDILAPPFHLSSHNVSFVDCMIEFFDNCNTLQPLLFNSSYVSIRGGVIQGGLILPNARVRDLTDRVHNIEFDNVSLRCQKFAGARQSAETYTPAVPTISSPHAGVFLGGDEIQLYDEDDSGEMNVIYKNNNSTYKVYYLGTPNVQPYPNSEAAYFVTTNPGRIRLGDNLVPHTNTIDLNESEMGTDNSFYGALGYVSAINGDTIFISGVPYGMQFGQTHLYVVDYPRFYFPLWGDISSGSNVIQNIDTYGSIQYPPLGARIFNPAFPDGSYVVDKDEAAGIIVMSTNATTTIPKSLIRNVVYEQTILRNSNQWPPSTVNSSLPSPPKQVPYIEGSRFLFRDVDISINGYVTTEGGFIHSAFPPTYGALTH